MMASAVPSCLAEAYRFLAHDRAFVAVLNGEEEIVVQASLHTVADLRRTSCAEYLDPRTDPDLRAAALIGGVVANAERAGL